MSGGIDEDLGLFQDIDLIRFQDYDNDMSLACDIIMECWSSLVARAYSLAG